MITTLLWALYWVAPWLILAAMSLRVLYLYAQMFGLMDKDLTWSEKVDRMGDIARDLISGMGVG